MFDFEVFRLTLEDNSVVEILVFRFESVVSQISKSWFSDFRNLSFRFKIGRFSNFEIRPELRDFGSQSALILNRTKSLKDRKSENKLKTMDDSAEKSRESETVQNPIFLSPEFPLDFRFYQNFFSHKDFQREK